MADESKDEKRAEGSGGGGRSGAGLGMFLGMFMVLALVLGGVTVFLQPALEEGGQKEGGTSGKSAVNRSGRQESGGQKKILLVKIPDLAFAFAGTHLKKKAAVTIVFTLPYGDDEDILLFTKDLLGDKDKDDFYAVQNTTTSGRRLLKALKRFFLAKKDSEFFAPDSEERVAKELRSMVQRFIQEDLLIQSDTSPLVGTVDYCDINVNPY